jgi:hypothetical protein
MQRYTCQRCSWVFPIPKSLSKKPIDEIATFLRDEMCFEFFKFEAGLNNYRGITFFINCARCHEERGIRYFVSLEKTKAEKTNQSHCTFYMMNGISSSSGANN